MQFCSFSERLLRRGAKPRGGELVSSYLARGQGFEPRLPGPEPGVLPLDDPRI